MNLHRNCLSLHVSISKVGWWEHASRINCSYREDTPHGNSSASIAGIAPRSAFPEKVGVRVSRETRTSSRYSNLLDQTGRMTLRRSIYPSDQSRSSVRPRQIDQRMYLRARCIHRFSPQPAGPLSSRHSPRPRPSSDVALPSIEARRSHPPSCLNPAAVVDRSP